MICSSRSPAASPAPPRCFAAHPRPGLASRRVTVFGKRPTSNTEDYTSSDFPERRKNPELYKNLRLQGPQEAVLPASDAFGGNTGEDTPAAQEIVAPEVLAPAGGWPQLRAAVENGADCVYFGITDFNARARAENFTIEELPEVMEFLHDRGVRGFVTLNILVFDTELDNFEDRVKAIAEAGVDAVIVQDIGAVDVIRRAAPNLPIHGSTQMSVTSPEGARFIESRGVKRVVVGRELSSGEIGLTKQGTSAEVEAFVHGAMCVSYSGQCFSSEAWGGRSANRGQCAQACRLPYGLIVNGVIKELGDVQYLLSPQDLMGLNQVPALVKAGVSCLKIEGRLKGPEYVAATTAVYRAAVDHAVAALQKGASLHEARLELPQQQMTDLRQVFARGQDEEHDGLSAGFLGGVAHQTLVRGRAPRHRGVLLGRVSAVDASKGGVWVELQNPVKRGDGVVFDAGNPADHEQGGSVMAVLAADVAVGGKERARAPGGRGRGRGRGGRQQRGGGKGKLRSMDGEFGGPEAMLQFRGVDVEFNKVRPGDLVWRSLDATLESRLRATYESKADTALRRVPVQVTASGTLGEPLVLRFGDRQGHVVTVSTESALISAEKRPMDASVLSKALGKTLGGGSMALEEVSTDGLDLAAGLFMSPSEIKEARRQAVEQLMAARRFHGRGADLSQQSVLPDMRFSAARGNEEGAGAKEDSDAPSPGAAFVPDPEGEPQISLLCRSQEQVTAALEVPWLQEIVLDFLEVHGLQNAVKDVQAAGKKAVVATPRILKPDEQRLSSYFLKLGADAILVRSTGMLHVLEEAGGEGAWVDSLGVYVPPLLGDFSLNAANVLTADALLRSGIRRLAPTHDLNAQQISSLAKSLGSRSNMVEAILHQHLPIFHMEHCVFCRFLSSGNSYIDCGHPCEKNAVHLRDGQGKDHLVLADMGCRNTVFNAQAQSGIHYLGQLVGSGVKQFRVELVDEPPELVAPLLEGYLSVMEGRRSADDLWGWLAGVPDANGNSHGVTKGSLEVHKERSPRKMKQTAASLR